MPVDGGYALGSPFFNAACVTALLSGRVKNADDEALTHLKRAFQFGYGRKQAPTDPDLENLRRLPRFWTLLGK